MLKESEALILRSYPLREADLLVSFFTRSEGKVRGVARSAKKSRRRFGGALEPLTYVHAFWDDRERHELARLDSCDVLSSPLSDPIDFARAAALAHVAEVLDELLPDREANDAIFRLAIATLPHLRVVDCHPERSEGSAFCSAIWMPLTYFDLWITRLTGLLPELATCIACGTSLDGSKAFFHPLADGLLCANDRRLGLTQASAAPRAALAGSATLEMSAASRALAAQMLSSSIDKFAVIAGPADRARDLRRFLTQLIERHIEKRLATVKMLEKL
jgi:DNA repair protein RecO (recombination protein O)